MTHRPLPSHPPDRWNYGTNACLTGPPPHDWPLSDIEDPPEGYKWLAGPWKFKGVPRGCDGAFFWERPVWLVPVADEATDTAPEEPRGLLDQYKQGLASLNDVLAEVRVRVDVSGQTPNPWAEEMTEQEGEAVPGQLLLDGSDVLGDDKIPSPGVVWSDRPIGRIFSDLSVSEFIELVAGARDGRAFMVPDPPVLISLHTARRIASDLCNPRIGSGTWAEVAHDQHLQTILEVAFPLTPAGELAEWPSKPFPARSMDVDTICELIRLGRRAPSWARDAHLDTTTGAARIYRERRRQQTEEGWSPEHDDQYTEDQLISAAACYLQEGENYPQGTGEPMFWPFDGSWWKPSTPIRDLEKAGALIAAEIDRRLRAGESEASEAPADSADGSPDPLVAALAPGLSPDQAVSLAEYIEKLQHDDARERARPRMTVEFTLPEDQLVDEGDEEAGVMSPQTLRDHLEGFVLANSMTSTRFLGLIESGELVPTEPWQAAWLTLLERGDLLTKDSKPDADKVTVVVAVMRNGQADESYTFTGTRWESGLDPLGSTAGIAQLRNAEGVALSVDARQSGDRVVLDRADWEVIRRDRDSFLSGLEAALDRINGPWCVQRDALAKLLDRAVPGHIPPNDSWDPAEDDVYQGLLNLARAFKVVGLPKIDPHEDGNAWDIDTFLRQVSVNLWNVREFPILDTGTGASIEMAVNNCIALLGDVEDRICQRREAQEVGEPQPKAETGVTLEIDGKVYAIPDSCDTAEKRAAWLRSQGVSAIAGVLTDEEDGSEVEAVMVDPGVQPDSRSSPVAAKPSNEAKGWRVWRSTIVPSKLYVGTGIEDSSPNWTDVTPTSVRVYFSAGDQMQTWARLIRERWGGVADLCVGDHRGRFFIEAHGSVWRDLAVREGLLPACLDTEDDPSATKPLRSQVVEPDKSKWRVWTTAYDYKTVVSANRPDSDGEWMDVTDNPLVCVFFRDHAEGGRQHQLLSEKRRGEWPCGVNKAGLYYSIAPGSYWRDAAAQAGSLPDVLPEAPKG